MLRFNTFSWCKSTSFDDDDDNDDDDDDDDDELLLWNGWPSKDIYT